MVRRRSRESISYPIRSGSGIYSIPRSSSTYHRGRPSISPTPSRSREISKMPDDPDIHRGRSPVEDVRSHSPTQSSAGDQAIMNSRTYTSRSRSEEHTSELQSRGHLVCRLLREKKKETR